MSVRRSTCIVGPLGRQSFGTVWRGKLIRYFDTVFDTGTSRRYLILAGFCPVAMRTRRFGALGHLANIAKADPCQFGLRTVLPMTSTQGG